jgi:diguanylate cyclase (GGDEF)-like protein
MNVPHDPARALEDALDELRRAAHDGSGTVGAGKLIDLLSRVETHLESWVSGLRARVLSLQAELEKSNEVAATDALTGLGNRKAFDQRMAAAWESSMQNVTPLAVLLVDVDHFKAFNDRDGHLAGDECLKKVATIIRSAVDRPRDLACRYGGDEFAIILPDTDEPGVRSIADTIRRRVAQARFTDRGSKSERRVTVSIGVAVTTPQQGQDPTALISGADDRLYRAKSRGRNTVVLDAAPQTDSEKAPTTSLARVQKKRCRRSPRARQDVYRHNPR